MRSIQSALIAVIFLLADGGVGAFTLPDNFTDTPVIEGLQDPDGFDFSPDGRMFISERITGRLRVATYNSQSDTWTLKPTPFFTFNTPSQVRRSGGLRDITFDPNFASNGFVYAFYMSDDDLHNRVVRIKADDTNPDVADSAFGEQLLLHLPFNNSSSSGSHNGGALEFGGDGKLYITTGDGWEGEFAGLPVQSLTSFTGKVLRINADGSIPGDNPFFNATTGNFRAIYGLGLRNPYSMAKHPDTDELYINEARGTNKASIYLVEAAANYGHEGSSGLGNNRGTWGNASGAGGELITGGAWMPEGGLGDYPAIYNGRYFTALWGSNSSSSGRINTMNSDSDPTSQTFATGLGLAGGNGIPVKPVIARISADGELYYMLTTYTTSSGQIRRVQFTAQETVAAPVFDPPGGNTLNGVDVTITTATPDAEIRFTTDNQTPDQNATLFTAPIDIDQSTILRAKAFRENFNTSAETSAVYIIGDQSGNVPPDVDAGPDSVRFVGQTITLDGSATTDPDGDDDFLTGEQWQQLSGPSTDIIDATEEIAFFTPTEPGQYRFQLTVSDGVDSASDDVVHTIVRAPRVQQGLQVLYTFEEGGGTLINDVSGVGSPLNLEIKTPAQASILAAGGLSIDGAANVSSAVNGTTVAASKIIDQCKLTNEVSVEAWVYTDSLDQSGPGPVRIVSLSTNTTNRNFTLGQENDRFDTRLRTTATDNNGVPSLTVPASTVKLELTHVMYTRDASGGANIYINGVQQVADTVGGNLGNWNDSYALFLGNEATLDRQWLGDIFLAAVYCEALSAEQAQQNFSAGLPPFADTLDSDDDGLPDDLDNCPDDSNPGQQDLDGDLMGDVCDPDSDNDGVLNDTDPEPLNNKACGDSDSDQCDDCSRGVDGFGPLSDVATDNDGRDTDNDTLCDFGDPDDDDDGVDDPEDNCPLSANPDQEDGDMNGVGDACDVDLCVAATTQAGKTVTFCL